MFNIPPLIGNNGFGLQQSNNNISQDLRKLLYQEFRVMMKKEVEVMVIPIFHRMLVPIIENLIRTIVKEQIQSALAKFLASAQSNCGNELHTTQPRRLSLQFRNKLSRPISTGKDITGEGCDIEVALVDDLSGEIVESGPEANADVEIIARDANESEGETSEEFKRENVVGGSRAKESLLTGDVVLTLNRGVGTVRNVRFRNSRKWMKQNLYFKLCARVIDTFSGVHIQEAKSESFTVKDCRNKHTKKSEIPGLSDGVWRLKNIAKNKEIHKRLKKEGINTVEKFLLELFKDPDRLRHIAGMKKATSWEITVKHARTCHIDKRMSCFADPEKKNVVVFNLVDQVQGVVSECQYIPFENLSANDKTYEQKLVVDALDNRKEFDHFDDIDSVLRYFSSSYASVNPLNSQGMEYPGGQNIKAPNLINQCYRNQFNTSGQDICSSPNSGQGTPREMEYVPQNIDDFNSRDIQVYMENTYSQEPEALPLEKRSDNKKADAREQVHPPGNWNGIGFFNDEDFSSLHPASSGAMEQTRDQNVEAPEMFSECNSNWPCISPEEISPPFNSAGGTSSEMHHARETINALSVMDDESLMEICRGHENLEDELWWGADTFSFPLDHTSSERLQPPEGLDSEPFGTTGQCEFTFSEFNDFVGATPGEVDPGLQSINDSYMMDDQQLTEPTTLSASPGQSHQTAAPDTGQGGSPPFKKWCTLINVLSLTRKLLCLTKSLVVPKKPRLH